jgi:hypothetical protein
MNTIILTISAYTYYLLAIPRTHEGTEKQMIPLPILQQESFPLICDGKGVQVSEVFQTLQPLVAGPQGGYVILVPTLVSFN